MTTEEQEFDVEYESEKEFEAKFLLDPDIPEEVTGQYSHLDKNVAITNLRSSKKEGVDEPEEFRSLARGMHVLNNRKYYKEQIINVFTGDYQDAVGSDGVSIVQVPVYRQEVELVPLFPKMFHAIKSEIFTMSVASGSRQGHRIRAARTTRREKSESFEQKSSISGRWKGSKN